jgi:hypothetical protein
VRIVQTLITQTRAEAFSIVKAADILDLGVILKSRCIDDPSGEPDCQIDEWVVIVLSEVPYVKDSGEDDAGAKAVGQ